jgi:signal transduction histidine kinase
MTPKCRQDFLHALDHDVAFFDGMAIFRPNLKAHVDLFRYFLAVLIVALALIARLGLDSLFHARQPYPTFYMSVMFAIWFLRLGPAIIAMILGGLAAHYFITPPRFSFAFESVQDFGGILVYLVTSSSIILFGHAFRVAREKSEQKRRELQGEIRHRQEAETALQAAKDQAEDANRIKDQFLATISHELRSPLNAILGWTQAIKMGLLGEEEKLEAIDTIERNGKAQAHLIEDILDVSRIIRGKFQINHQQVDLVKVVKAAVKTIQPEADLRSIRIETILNDGGQMVLGDFNRLQQVVWNLLSNSIKFSSPGERVTIRLERAEDAVRIVVADRGKGISSEFLPHLFERFRQEDSSSTRKYSGLGLGLAIVREIVELHHGAVLAESEGPGRGTIFTVTLPSIRPAGESSRSSSETSTPANAGGVQGCLPDLRGRQILVVDDEDSARDLVSKVLESCGAAVRPASTAVDALRQFSAWKPNALVSDIAMPEMNGFTLIEKVREMEAGTGMRTPAIALTAYASAEDRTRALKSGFDRYISKPVDVKFLANLVASLL